MKTLLIICIFLLIGFASFGQEKITKKNNIAVGLYFPTFGISYDRIFLQKSAWKFSGQINFAPFNTFNKIVVGGVGLNAFRGRLNSHLQIGLNYTFLHTKADESQNKEAKTIHLITPTIGYRYQKPAGGLFFTANIGPMFGFLDDSPFIPIPGGSIGLGFSF